MNIFVVGPLAVRTPGPARLRPVPVPDRVPSVQVDAALSVMLPSPASVPPPNVSDSISMSVSAGIVTVDELITASYVKPPLPLSGKSAESQMTLFVQSPEPVSVEVTSAAST